MAAAGIILSLFWQNGNAARLFGARILHSGRSSALQRRSGKKFALFMRLII